MAERSEQEQVRQAKLAKLRGQGFAFPNDTRVDTNAAVALALSVSEPAESGKRLTLAGRLVQIRQMGKAAFAHLLDSSGKIQIYVKRDILGDPAFAEFVDMDLGDIIEARGYVFKTKTGEQSLFVEELRLLVKALRPLPEKWHGLTDVEARYRHRYLDLIANPEVRDVFRKRAAIIQAVRAFLDGHGFVEVETPVLHYVPGGAMARPFRTHHNTLDTEMFLRIALELPLKKLVVGGLERVYEIGRNFRNEGISKKHNPEFTMLEFYQAYATFEDLMNLTEELFLFVLERLGSARKITYQGNEIDFTRPWKRISMRDSIHEVGGVARTVDLGKLEGLHVAAGTHSIELVEPKDWGRSLEALWGALVEPKLLNPTFITHHPFSISPLARRNPADPTITDRFELIVAGMEAANAFSELNDAEDQRARFEDQASRKAAGDEEACDVDEDFLRALEHGMPPTAGQGIGIDRLVMLLTDSASIRDVLLFPQLKPEVREEAVNPTK